MHCVSFPYHDTTKNDLTGFEKFSVKSRWEKRRIIKSAYSSHSSALNMWFFFLLNPKKEKKRKKKKNTSFLVVQKNLLHTFVKIICIKIRLVKNNSYKKSDGMISLILNVNVKRRHRSYSKLNFTWKDQYLPFSFLIIITLL